MEVRDLTAQSSSPPIQRHLPGEAVSTPELRLQLTHGWGEGTPEEQQLPSQQIPHHCRAYTHTHTPQTPHPTHTHAHTHTRARAHARAHTHTRTDTDTHTDTHTHTHTTHTFCHSHTWLGVLTQLSNLTSTLCVICSTHTMYSTMMYP